ncbi:MAG: PQQ-like beta-propeller repeat protein [bacterium]|nr:PQQ-like beta-propeller repeat protein [bacterium]
MKRKIIISLSIIVLIATFFVIRKLVKNYHKKWDDIEFSHMADFTGDGNQELLLIYDGYKEKSPMKLINVETNETIWKSFVNTHYLPRMTADILVKDSILAIVYDDDSTCVTGFITHTGKKIWDFKLKNDRKRSILYKISEHNNKLFIFTERNSEKYLTSIDIKTGKEIREVSLPNSKVLVASSFVKNKTVLSNNPHIDVIDIESGKAHYNITNFDTENYQNIAEVLCTDSTIFVIKNRRYVYKYDSVLHEIEYRGKPLVLDATGFGFINTIAFSDKGLFCFADIYKKGIGVRYIPLTSEDNEYTYYFKDSLIHKHPIIVHIPFKKLDYIKAKYIPLVIESKVDSTYSKKQLIVFDLEKGEITWQSKTTDIDYFIAGSVSYHTGNYLITIEKDMNNSELNNIYITLDGNTGKFSGNIELLCDVNNLPNPMWYGCNKFSGNYYYGSSYDIFWVMSYPKLELKYTSGDNIKSKDAKEELEELFGEMPWNEAK